MEETKLVEEILEIASELDRGDITFDEAQIKAETLVKIDRYEQLTLTDVVWRSEQLNTAWKALKWVGFERGNEFDDDDINEMLGI
jgi:hypothetical protein